MEGAGAGSNVLDPYDLRDPRLGFLIRDWWSFLFLRFGLLITNVPLP
jgi:hypothetical protein